METETENEDLFGDIGNLEVPNIDINLLDFVPADEVEETRYTLPKVCLLYTSPSPRDS